MSHEVLHYGKLAPGEKGRMFVRCANSRNRRMALSFEVPAAYVNSLSFKEKLTITARISMPMSPQANGIR